MQPIPSVLLFYPKKAENPVLLCAQAPVYIDGAYQGNATIGPILRMESDEFENVGWWRVVELLQEFGPEAPAEKSEYDLMTSAARQRMRSQYDDLLVSLREDGNVWIDTEGSKRRGKLTLNDTAETFVKRLRALLV